MRTNGSLSIIMPVYNEARTIAQAISHALQIDQQIDIELIVVDDGSTDGTSDLLQPVRLDSRVQVLAHQRNSGKGAAIRTGLEVAQAPVTVILDADLELSATSVIQMFALFDGSTADLVIGARPLTNMTGQPFLFRLGNQGLTQFANWLFQAKLRDLMAGLKMMYTDLFRSLGLVENGFAVEAEIVARAIQHHARISHVAVPYRARGSNEGKKLTMIDGIRVIQTLMRCRLDGPEISPNTASAPQ